MGNFDFTGLSTSSFESLAQALAVKVLGAGTIIFGAGPDGGREATYEGRVSYPSAAEQWDGYIVLQAKFRQRLTDRETDAEWAIKLLREELDKYVEGKGGRRAPDYYIFVTNVVLTPVQKKGGKDRVAKVFNDYRKKLPIKGWRVWDYDQLATFLDAEESVRRAFTAFITSGDVLAEVMQWLKPARADFEEVMTGYLSRELNNAKHADLESGDHRILLSRVFVDLPLYKERLAEPPDEAEKPLDGVVATIIEAARERLDHSYRVGRSVAEDPVIARFVIVGGPGQGKTTAGQFACQLFRAAILKDRRGRLAEEVVTALDEIVTISEREKIELPRARRFPLHVVLRDFATALNRRKSAITGGQPLPDLTLFGYLVDRIGGRTDQKVTADDFRAWLRAYPWLLVLDGLDEVPSASNRGDVLQAIEEFWMEATQANADLLMIATTRPQDYQDDFSPAYYAHRWLAPLSPERALRYGKRLLEVRHGTDSDRSAELFARMEKAAASESTARLMRTPLQITIMATLVETIGTPPQDRWRLFREYYGAIYRRERERTPSELLGKYESDINAIHYRTGFELQIMSESPGQTEARLSKEQFEAIVRGRLEEQGHEGDALERLVREIVAAAAYRLVFIVGLDVDQVGFEIRSLQEFMAAEALLGLGGDTATMQKRLRAIAGVQSWRNVFIFAAGRCFADLESLIDTIHAICRELNGEASVVAKAIQEGSMLALELLEDAAVGAKPKHARLLAETALELLSAPPGDVHARLAAAHSDAVDALYREEITRHLKLAALGEQLGAWKTLLHLMDRGVVWAEGLATTYWPKWGSTLEVVGAVGDVGGVWLSERAERLITRFPRDQVRTKLPTIIDRLSADLRRFLLRFVTHGERGDLATSVRSGKQELTSFTLRIVSIGRFERSLSEIVLTADDIHPTWRPVLLLTELRSPLNAETLAKWVDQVRDLELKPNDYAAYVHSLPWPAGLMLIDATPESLTAHAAALRERVYGDRDDWLEAEKRWAQEGLDVRELSETALSLSRDVATRGYPYQVCSAWVGNSDYRIIASELAQAFRRASAPFRATVADWLLFVASLSEEPTGVADEIFCEALAAIDGPVLPDVAMIIKGSSVAPAFVDSLGRKKEIYRFTRRNETSDFVVSLLRQAPALTGIACVAEASLRASTVRACRDLLPVLESNASDPRHCRFAVAALNAISGNCKDPEKLGMTIAREFPEDAGRVADLLVAPYRPCDEELLLILDAKLPPDAWRSRVSVRRTLENLQKSKPGPERGRAFWEELGFARVNLAG